MALQPVNPGLNPLGLFDVLNTQAAGLTGGEVMTLAAASRTNTATETAAADVLDGYNYATPGLRPVAQLATTVVPFVALADEGSGPHYFTVIGSVVGANSGKQIRPTVQLGPNTGAGSGKVTLWDKPGLYEVTIDSLVPNFVSTLTTGGITPGSVLGYAATGKISHSTGASALANSGLGVFVEFSGNSSLVTTPAYLVGARPIFDRIKIEFMGGTGRTVPSSAS